MEAKQRVIQGDCLQEMAKLPDQIIDLVICDPPFNIGYNAYDAYDDSMPERSYLTWCSRWLQEIWRLLKSTGTFWLVIGDERAAQLKMIAEQHELLTPEFRWPKGQRFFCRSWCIHYFTFGVAQADNFARSHIHLLYFTKNRQRWTFNAEAVRVPSARQLVYNDKRHNPQGKLPDNVWILLPADLKLLFTPEEDVWLASRVCGTFKERQSRGETGGLRGVPQLPSAIVERMVLVCSSPGGTVLDPMSGTGTTAEVCVHHNRKFIGYELSADCAQLCRKRIEKAQAKIRAEKRGKSGKTARKDQSS